MTRLLEHVGDRRGGVRGIKSEKKVKKILIKKNADFCQEEVTNPAMTGRGV